MLVVVDDLLCFLFLYIGDSFVLSAHIEDVIEGNTCQNSVLCIHNIALFTEMLSESIIVKTKVEHTKNHTHIYTNNISTE